jgi:asparagine synthase (glutamine-hydrolysing)
LGRFAGFCDPTGLSTSADLGAMVASASLSGGVIDFRLPPMSWGLATGGSSNQPVDARRGGWIVACDGWVERMDTHGHDEPENDELDTDAMQVRAVLERGPGSVVDLDGEFSFAAVDPDRRRLHLARDRWGTKPLYYGRVGPLFLFASDLRALSGHRQFTPRLDPDMLAAYLAFDAVPVPYCILKDVRKVLPGHVITVDLETGEHAEHCYWHLADELNRPLADLDEPTARQALRDTFAAAVHRRRERCPNAGVFLTSGYDSSLIAALLQRESGRPIRTFCVGFAEEAAVDEGPRAKIVADHIGTDHVTIPCRAQDVRQLTLQLPQIFDEPLGVHSLVPSVLAWRTAAHDVPALMVGDGSSTLIGPGAPRPLWGPYSLYDRLLRLPRAVRRPFASAARAGLGTRWPRSSLPDRLAARDRVDLVRAARRGPGFRYASDRELASLLAFEFTLPVGHYHDLRRLELPADRFELASRVVHHGEQATSACDRMFVRIESAAAASGATAYYPFTDARFLELALRLPARFKHRDGTSKALFKDVVDDVVGEPPLARRKLGFESPNWLWLSTSCADLLDAHLDSRALDRTGLFRGETVCRMRRALTDGRDLNIRKASASRLRQILYFQLWLEHWKHYGLSL